MNEIEEIIKEVAINAAQCQTLDMGLIKRAAYEISQLNNKDEWISVDIEPVLEDEIMWKRFWCYYKLHDTNRFTQGLKIFERMPDDTFRWANSGITHWMPLPQPPKTKEGE